MARTFICRAAKPWALFGLVASLCLMGCGTGPLTGLAYTKVRLPLTRDLDNTPAPASTPGTGKIINLREPFSGFGVGAQFDSNAIAEIARRNGMSTVFFADKEVFSILGIWTRTEVIIYGEKDPNQPPFPRKSNNQAGLPAISEPGGTP